MLKTSFPPSRTSRRSKQGKRGHTLVSLGLALIALFGILATNVRASSSYLTPESLQQAVDAAARAAASNFQLTAGHSTAGLIVMTQNMTQAAQDSLAASGIQPVDSSVEWCYTQPADLTLCTTPMRKLVRVRVTALVGVDQTPLTVESIGEAASLDIVLVLDTSESMTYGAAAGSALRDPKNCNPNNCQPFETMKSAAADFANQVLFAPYDRMSVVSFNQYALMSEKMTEDVSGITNAISALTVFQPARCPYSLDTLMAVYGTTDLTLIPAPPAAADPGYTPFYPGDPRAFTTCRLLSTTGGAFMYMDCPMAYGPSPDPSHCGSSNLGSGIGTAGAILQANYQGIASVDPSIDTNDPATWPADRPDALHMVVLMTDGPPNAGYKSSGFGTFTAICPVYTWGYAYGNPICQDKNPSVRHAATDPLYDVDDYARDMFDNLAANHVTIDTIGLGNGVKIIPAGQTLPLGETLLKYPSLPLDQGGLNAGHYYYALDASSLPPIFQAIAAAPVVVIAPPVIATDTPTPADTLTFTPTSTGTLTPTLTLTNTRTLTRTRTATPTVSPTHTATIALTSTITLTGTDTTTPTETSTPTTTRTPRPSRTATLTSTDTLAATISPTDTATTVLTPTITLTSTPTETLSPTVTLTNEPSLTPTATRTSTPTSTPTTAYAVQTFTSLGAQDGWILETGQFSNTGGILNATATTLRVGDDALNRQYRDLLSFNTTGLPDNAVIVSATLKLKRQGGVGLNPFFGHRPLVVDVCKPYFGSLAGLQPSDFQAKAGLNAVSQVNSLPVAGYYRSSLSGAALTQINTTGLTQLRLRFLWGDNNDFSANYIAFYSGNALTVSYRPVLEIRYTLP